MKNLAVHWTEGMFLRPHHFQAADRYWAETLHTSEHWDHPYGYGVRDIQFSKDAIANYQVEVTSLHARLRDGTLIAIEANQGLDRVDLRAAFETRQTVKVFLAVPRLKLGNVNVGHGGDGGRSRYLGLTQSLQDESLGGNDQEVGLRAPNVRLMLEGQEMDGYELLPLVQLRRTGDADPTPQIDKSFFPPALAIDGWPDLAQEIVRYIYDKIGNRVELFTAQVIARNVTFASQHPNDAALIFLLSELNEAYAKLGVMTFCTGLHPLIMYTELVRIIGALSIFGEAGRRTPLDIPQYDHDDLGRIFWYCRRKIEALLEPFGAPTWEQRFFEGWGKGMRCGLDPKWLGRDWQWYVGATFSGNITETECRRMLAPGILDWKLGSERQVDDLFEYGLEGLHLIPMERTPRPLPERGTGGAWIYYQVTRDNAAFKDVQDTESLAMRLNEKYILNYNTLKGQQKLSVRYENKQIVLEFALFAVPKG